MGFTSSTAIFTSLSSMPSCASEATRSEPSVAKLAAPAAPAPAACMRPWVFKPCVAAHALSITVTLAPVSNRKSWGGPPSTLALSQTCRAR
jgi:hypothetical protein